MLGVAGLVVVAPPSGAADEVPVYDCSLLEVRPLLEQPLDGLSDDDLLVRIGHAAILGDHGIDEAVQAALNGTATDVRAFFEGGWESPYRHDLRVRLAQLAHLGDEDLKREASDAMDIGTVEALEEFLLAYDCTPPQPGPTTTTTTTTTVVIPTTVAPTTTVPGTPAPATPIVAPPSTSG